MANRIRFATVLKFHFISNSGKMIICLFFGITIPIAYMVIIGFVFRCPRALRTDELGSMIAGWLQIYLQEREFWFPEDKGIITGYSPMTAAEIRAGKLKYGLIALVVLADKRPFAQFYFL